jgi:hypothetical protein
MLVHCRRRLSAAVTVLAAKIPRCDGVFTEWALELGKAVHHLDRVMSRSLIVCAHFSYDSKPKVAPDRPLEGNRSGGGRQLGGTRLAIRYRTGKSAQL